MLSEQLNENLKYTLACLGLENYWQPIKTWTTIALTISQNGLALSTATVAMLVTQVIYRLILIQQEKALLLTLYNKLPTETPNANKSGQKRTETK